MTISRRRFIGTSAAAAAAVSLSPKLGFATKIDTADNPVLDDAAVYALAEKGIEAAIAAGATYAEARLSQTRQRRYMNGPPGMDGMEYGVGIRVLYNGYWGFYSSVVWTQDEMVRLANGAVMQAKAFSRGRTEDTPLAPVAPIVRGEWVMPVKYDPFDVPVGEQVDVMTSYTDFLGRYKFGVGGGWTVAYSRQTSYFASSEGSSWKQVTYNTGASFSANYRDQYSLELGQGGAGSPLLTPAGMGWERISECGFYENVPKLIEEAELTRHIVPVDINRYEAVLAPGAVAGVLGATIGGATQLDRALGYEANAGGTSYINEPFEMIGNYKIGSPKVNITAGRSAPGGLATVKWDDEGVAPKDFTIVKDGILHDFQTNREQAEWLRDSYKSLNRPVESNGCAGSQGAKDAALQMTPNLTLEGDPNGPTFDEMVKGIEKGVAVMSLAAYTDQQFLNAVGRGSFREIVNGKLGRYIYGAGTLFRTPEFWNAVETIGKASDSEMHAQGRGKGQPYQSWSFSATAPAVHLKQLDVIDAMRKAS